MCVAPDARVAPSLTRSLRRVAQRAEVAARENLSVRDSIAEFRRRVLEQYQLGRSSVLTASVGPGPAVASAARCAAAACGGGADTSGSARRDELERQLRAAREHEATLQRKLDAALAANTELVRAAPLCVVCG
jgi:hypothetical protein